MAKRAPPKKRAPKAKKSTSKPAKSVASATAPAKNADTLPFEIDPKRIEASLQKLKDELVHWANKGRYTRVRFKFRGKQLLPDLPLAAVVAAEGLTFYWGGILRTLIFNVAGNAVLEVELVNDSNKRIQKGKEELLSGNLDGALAEFREAVAMERDNPQAHLNLGVALKLKGDFAAARQALEKAKEIDPQGPVGGEADRLLSGLTGTAIQVARA
jgi:tetratricopeptide (TPR) repeat protein